MASHIEMKRVADDAAAVRSLARRLQGASDAGWTDWELDFLDSMARFEGPGPLSQRQREVLSELQDRTRTYTRLQGLSVARLVQLCSEARADLDEDDQEFVTRLAAEGTRVVRQGAARRLLRCARQLHYVEGYVSLA